MTDKPTAIRLAARHTAVALAFACLVASGQALAQSAQPAQPLPPAVEAEGPPAPEKKEGFAEAFKGWLDQSAADFKSNWEKMKEFNERAAQNAKEFNEKAFQGAKEFNEKAAQNAKEAAAATAAVTKDATEALMKLPNTRVIEGKETCELAPNGSPDCAKAAEKICKAKGFGGGKSAEVQQVRKCSARAWLDGAGQSACTNESIVVRATCQ
jgi:hypothetical protein